MGTVRQTVLATVECSELHRDEFVVTNLPLVVCIARQIRYRLPPEVLLEDLVNDGVLGLMDAVRKYDPRKKVEIECYARFRIRGAILDSLRQGDWGPRSLRRMGRHLQLAISRCQARLHRDPIEQEVAEELHVTLERLRRLVSDLHGLAIGSTDDEAIEFKIQNNPLNQGSMQGQEDPFSRTLRAEMKTLLRKTINDLPDRQRDVLRLYHFSGLSMKEVGSALGIGESRVSQIHTAALIQLRSRLAGLLGQGAPPMPV
jgi:RNA polymerase sigma factor for flagellar operon FliA